MRDLSKFGTDEFPLHSSGLKALVRCPWEVVMKFLSEPGEDHGVAGNTGSAMHVAAAEFHRGKEIAACLESMATGIDRYPLANLQEAAEMFLHYSTDPRNAGAEFGQFDGRPVIEEKLEFFIDPAPEDPTRQKIKIVGTGDQVRRENGRLKYWDIKTSKLDPMEIRDDTLYQAAAYCVGLTFKLGEPVHPGGVICPRRYKPGAAESSPVFWHFPWTLEDTGQILKGVRHMVALIRQGHLWHIPGRHCTWCPAKTPDLCLPQLVQLQKRMSDAAA